ncbi:uncharacterized protein BDV14DRAFT_196110 [Aspergillus stella-maris]|uniref:uncharacterized protein n=1 Tax=Aspergillus stella-maris TaxID=1810926 RepID=UPI003CCE0DD1
MDPFTNAREYYSTFVERYLEMIWDGQLSSAYPMNAYLVFKYLKELAEAERWNAFEADLDNGPFYLKHMDDKGDRILVDEEYNITGIIDWAFARSVPAFEAFGPSLFTADTDALFNGESGRSSKDDMLAQALGRIDKNLGHIASGPDLVRRFSFALGMGMSVFWEEAEALFHGIVSTATGIKLEFDWEVWRQNRLYQWPDDSNSRICFVDREGSMRPGRRPAITKCIITHLDSQLAPGMTVPDLVSAERVAHNLSDAAWEKSITNEITYLLSTINTQELMRLATQINKNTP